MQHLIRQPLIFEAPSLGKMTLKRCMALLLFSLLQSAPVYAGEVVSQKLDAPADAVISINNTRGEIEILGWDASSVEIDGELDDLAEKLIFKVDGQMVTIDVCMPAKDVNWGDGSDLKIHVPQGSRVKFVGVSTDVSAENIRGGLQLQTVSGDIFAENIGAQLIINAISGDIKVDGSTGRLRASAISGDLRIVSSATDVAVETVSGDLQVALQDFDQVSLRSVSGEIAFSGYLNDSGELDVSSVSGDIELGLQSALNATAKVVAGFSGSINNNWNDARADRSGPMGQQLKLVLGNGSAQISARSVSADITLLQDD